MKRCILIFGQLILFSQYAFGALSAEFPVRITMAVCPEINFQNVSIELKYTIGTGTELFPIEVTSQNIDTEALIGTFEILLPATLGVNDINITAYCVNSIGSSPASNVVSLSNCDALEQLDTDGDGITNNLEDLNCDNFFSPGDSSNPDNVDTDGDGVRDLVETVEGTSPTNPGSSPRPFIFAGAPFDPDGNGNSNPVAWRPSSGTWFIRDFSSKGNHLSVPFGQAGDIPFVYDSPGVPTGVGVVRSVDNTYFWNFRGAGFINTAGLSPLVIPFGIFGDNIIPGPWETPGVTNPAVARLFNNQWTFYILLSDGNIRVENWGGNGDVPKVQDYDGDGLFDIAVFRPSEQKTYVIGSETNDINIYNFGSGTADHTVRGDVTGDGIDDLTFWEPITGRFITLTSDNGFNDELAALEDPDFFSDLQLGLYIVHRPMSWNKQNGLILYTVVEHATGLRYTRPENNLALDPVPLQWGIPGDSLM